jgi:hypothetical protein
MVNPHLRALHECRTYHAGRGGAKRRYLCPRHEPASFHQQSGGRATTTWKPWLQAASTDIAFLVSFASLQWPFANFLMSPLSRNRIFGTHYFSYDDTAGFMYDPYKFQASENTRVQFWIVMTAALIAAILTTRLGLIWANWIRRVQR